MKLLITSSGPDLDADVDPRFGRAPWFLLIDSESGELLEAIENREGQEAAHGAGIGAAARIAEQRVERVYTGRLGPKAAVVLEKAGIEVQEGVSGPVREVVRRILESGGGATGVRPVHPSAVPRGQQRCGRSGGGRGRGGKQRCH